MLATVVGAVARACLAEPTPDLEDKADLKPQQTQTKEAHGPGLVSDERRAAGSQQ